MLRLPAVWIKTVFGKFDQGKT